MSEKLQSLLKMFSDFDENELVRILSSFKRKSVSKNDVLLHEGSICKEFYFVKTGCVRIFFVDKNGHEKTRYIMLDNHIGTALTSFISQKLSVEMIEALEDTELLAISHADFYRLNSQMDNWRNFYLRILEMAYSFQNRKIEQRVTLTAKQRYEVILNENPALVQQVSNKILASYLDIREETLSRLKSK
ncbi:Crp/Fnr family transcriptional regulator [Sphingobacterium hotanense]|uniref:Crp/Fnr family transcriptional regulator n=1 Tax=Sphingobacterium hotanense TaxID=649196 RepID=UPI0021A8A27E|nr:cyclic nucleotide-binding domain-containing protein [Sphingobacterium hotanense]MCT1523574.1 cyclic nucleotide-binding domain-containing protein [Sphingobacterium hotanense]